jgi:hypothetical protein
MADDSASRASDSTPKTAKSEEATIDRDRLIAEADAWVGYPSHVMAGAIAGNRKQKFSVNEAKAACKAYLGQEVK